MHLMPIYGSKSIQDWEGRWFAAGNISFGLMQQASLAMSLHLITWMKQNHIKWADIIVWCGVGNNGGDGYLVAKYLSESLDEHFKVQIIAPKPPQSTDCLRARAACHGLEVHDKAEQVTRRFERVIHLDAMFGNGLDRLLDEEHQALITSFNAACGTKIALDIPSGLHPDRGIPMPVCVRADMTLCVMGLKIGLFIGVAKEVVGQVVNLPLIPPDENLLALALLSEKPDIPKRHLAAHKGDFGTVAVIGGHQSMGGAVIMASQMAMSMGAGRVTAMCHRVHHSAMLTRSPNVMVADVERDLDKLMTCDRVAFGMGLGRDDWAEAIFHQVMDRVRHHHFERVVLDADALYWLANTGDRLPAHIICTPHAAEAARLLDVSVSAVNEDKLAALHRLHESYGGQWVMKGANTLSFDGNTVRVCPFGNAFMATAGMGDVLSGMLVGTDMDVHDVVAWHGILGDDLARGAGFGIHAQDMARAAGGAG